jgi:regulatory protein
MKSAKEKSLEYLGRFSRTEQQVRNYLSRKKYPAQEIDTAISYLHSQQLLNDLAFAEAFIQSRIRRHDGPLKIRQMLFQKGIDPQTAQELLKEQYPEDLQLEEAVALLAQRLRKESKASSSRATTQRRNRRNDATDALRHLASRGFSRYVIIQALKRL